MTDEEEIEHDMGMIYGQVSEDLGDGFREVELPVDLAPTSGTNSWRAVVPYLFTLCCFLIYMLIIATVPTANNLDFFERDPSVSYVCGQEQVPTETLVFVIIMLPAILFLAFVYLPAKNGLASLAITIDIDDRASSEYKLRKRSWFLMWVIIGFASCQLANLSVTETLKVLVGRKRPCFFYLCNYKGYKTAVDSDDYSSYDLATTANRPGNIEDCRASDDNTNEAQKSWPSGHASTPYTSLYIHSIYTPYTLHILFHPSHRSRFHVFCSHALLCFFLTIYGGAKQRLVLVESRVVLLFSNDPRYLDLCYEVLYKLILPITFSLPCCTFISIRLFFILPLFSLLA